MIEFACASCGKALKVKDEFSGRKSACPQCKKSIVVPLADATVDRPLSGDTPSSAEGERSSLEFLAPKQQPDELGRLGSYRVLKVLGSGGMGVVLQAEDPALKRLVALKVMRPELAANETNRQRFLREAQATAAVEHSHIVPILHVGQEGQVPYIALPFLKGEPLDERLKREKRLSVAEVVHIARQTAEGLAAAHEHGLIHRDIKPANLWLEASPGRKSGEINVKILDFGLARGLANETHLTQSGMIVGTPAYMAPEQARGEKVDARCDLYSLGVVLYRMCTGDVPFKSKDTLSLLSALALDTPTEPRQLNPDIPTALNDLIMRMLAKKPGERPASAAEVVDALRALQHDANATELWAPSASLAVQPSQPRRPRRPLLLIGGSAMLALLLIGGIALLASRGHQPPVESSKQPPETNVPGLQETLPTNFTNSLGMEFVLVPKGKFWIGGTGGAVGDKEVEIPHEFYLGKYEVTQEEWEKVTGLNPSTFSRIGNGKEAVKDIADAELKRFPVEYVSWDDCQAFLKLVNEKAKDAGWVYRLPTDAEWEYACRGGPSPNMLDSGFDFYFEKPSLVLKPDQANFNLILMRTCKVGSYQPNKLGLYDMHGNVWEWRDDELKGEDGASQRVYRGGCWGNDAGNCRAANRNAGAPSFRHAGLGLRLARVPVGANIQ